MAKKQAQTVEQAIKAAVEDAKQDNSIVDEVMDNLGISSYSDERFYAAVRAAVVKAVGAA